MPVGEITTTVRMMMILALNHSKKNRLTNYPQCIRTVPGGYKIYVTVYFETTKELIILFVQRKAKLKFWYVML